MRIFILLLAICFVASAQLVINNQVACVAVGISGQPTSVENLTNVALTLTVTASGTTPYAYQWHLGTSATNALAGATASSYSYTNQTAATNSYCAVVTNACGAITSAVATLAWTNGTSAPWDVTNLANCIASWAIDDSITNGTGSVTNIPNRQSANVWPLTGAGSWSASTGFNGHKYASGGAPTLTASAFTNYGYVEFAAVMRVNKYDTDKFYIEEVPSSPATSSTRITSAGTVGQWGNGFNGGNLFTTNSWQIVFCIHANTGGVMTNNVSNCALSSGTTTLSYNGLQVFDCLNADGVIQWAEIAAFSGTNSPTDRTTLYNSWKSKYGL